MGLIDLLFPEACLECTKGGTYICPDCLAKVRLGRPICAYCKKASIDGLTHIKCSKKYGLNGLTSVWEYEGIIRKAVLALKYKYSLKAGGRLSELFIKYLRSSASLLPDSATLVPIPIYWYRENMRGFNQSEEIGRRVAGELGWEFVPDLLIRSKHTRPQVELKREERKVNLKGVFALNSKFRSPDSVILFDDVFTTGSTLFEAAKVLKHAGVAKVWGLTIAR